MKNHLKCMAFIAVFIFSGIAHSAVKPASMFNDNMVLQRGKKVQVWGTAGAGEEVTVEFAGQKKKAKTDASGEWKVFLDPLEADAAGREMRIYSDKDKAVKIIKNVLTGEVWFCSGQSNMAFGMSRAADYEKDKADPNLPLISYLANNNKWLLCSSEKLAGFSAVAYYFARKIHRELNVPIGLIVRAVGGTPVEKWAPKEKILELDFAREAYETAKAPEQEEAYNKYNKAYSEFKAAYKKWRKENPKGKFSDPDRPKIELKRPENLKKIELFGGDRLGILYRQRVKPVIPYTIRGFIWYQGERDAHLYLTSYNYHKSLGVLINSWREAWGDRDTPFFFVQLPNYNSKSWPVIRESMAKVLDEVPDTGMAVAIDVGERGDIHPPNKAPVGERLALLALKKVYGREIFAVSPLYKAMSIDGNKAVISFKSVGGGLVLKKAENSCFVIAGEDKKFYPAQAEIEGNKVIVRSEKVQTPTAVRYAWEADIRK